VNSWYEKYHDKGLVIIGVHSPEFEFEKDINNIKAAVTKDGIKYPVAVDSEYGTWLNYHNKYWPAHYLIDKEGNVVYEHFGEGEYDVTEDNIRFLLGLNKVTADTPASENLADSFHKETPETYLGSARANSFASIESVEINKPKNYSFPQVLLGNNWALQGVWRVIGENIISAEKDAAVKIHFHAQKVYVVMGSHTNQPIPVKILLNGEQVVTNKGKDVNDSTIVVDKHALYQALEFTSPQDGILELIAPADGLEIYTFTFGSK
jgi:hypothetical protein